MTGFDIIVLVLVAVAAIGGFLRGFVQEVLSLASWILAAFTVRFLHSIVTVKLFEYMGTATGAAIVAFVLLLLIPYAAMKLIAGRLGETSRNSVLGPIDRVLGFGFGAIKGAIIVVMAFSVLVLGYDSVWGPSGRPGWISNARTYAVINSASDEMVELIHQRREELIMGDGKFDGTPIDERK